MAALFKYFVGIVVILPAVVMVYAGITGEVLLHIAATARAQVTETPRWNIAPVKVEPDTPYARRRLLSPIYPAIPGKDLLGTWEYATRRVRKPQELVSAKRIDARQALQLHKLPRQMHAASEQDMNYPQLSLSYAETRPPQPRALIIFGHGIY